MMASAIVGRVGNGHLLEIEVGGLTSASNFGFIVSVPMVMRQLSMKKNFGRSTTEDREIQFIFLPRLHSFHNS